VTVAGLFICPCESLSEGPHKQVDHLPHALFNLLNLTGLSRIGSGFGQKLRQTGISPPRQNAYSPTISRENWRIGL